MAKSSKKSAKKKTSPKGKKVESKTSTKKIISKSEKELPKKRGSSKKVVEEKKSLSEKQKRYHLVRHILSVYCRKNKKH